jgi:aldose 1-epimerase
MRTEGRQRRLRARTGLIALAIGGITVGGVMAAANASAVPQSVSKTAAVSTASSHPSVSKKFFGNAVEPFTGKLTPTYQYTLSNAHGVKVQLLSYGAITQAIWVPDRHGRAADVVLGFKTLSDYVNKVSPPVTANGGPYFGETIGRYGNRIAKGTFQLKQPDGQTHTYTLPINNGANSLHGGLVGFGNHVWKQIHLVATKDKASVTLELVSPNGDSSGSNTSAGCTGFANGCTGYPAQLTVDVTFSLNNAGQYGIHYSVRNDSPNLNTVVNLTNHSYFNLAGESSGSAANQPISINASKYTPTDATQIPLGTEVPVKGTPFDFRHARTIASGIADCTQPNSQACQQLLISQGYDHNWVLNSNGPKFDGLNLAATASDPGSGRNMQVWTDQPGVQFYTSNFLNGTLVGISGHIYRQTQAYTFETQHFPDSPNQANFPSTELAAGHSLNSTTIFAFSS